jgi:hypothetical protein
MILGVLDLCTQGSSRSTNICTPMHLDQPCGSTVTPLRGFGAPSSNYPLPPLIPHTKGAAWRRTLS